MRIFESEAIYNAETGIWEELYFIDDEEVDFEEYVEQQKLEVKLENDKLREEECCCDCCDCEEITIGELIDVYVERFEEGYNCSVCVRDLLTELVCDILEWVEN